ncbi:polysaccharide deacetylase family protein [uncultured Clostridium sp.]|uniref:polysaccharide deacetylase family protein n=1 Tax=uncultured Clostridium sp. TaxID=59620 RepID=UPI0025F7BC6C|nr:polysaccharide deacetylase family protein [uncultured Clostridium sp.]
MKFKKFTKMIGFALLITSIFSFNIYTANAEEKNESRSEAKVIYLTFDDGPAGKITNNVLDILKENEVHATFFLIGSQIKGQEDLVKRIYDEGHSIGLHSMTHKKNCLYCSNEQFLKEMLDTQQLISTIIPIKPAILRFPFGCNNNTYKISQSMVDLLHENNLKIYDWNTDSGDGANPNSAPFTLLKNSKSNKDRVVLLMHCGYLSKNSVKALPCIINYYKDNEYEFKTIDENTPEEFHFMKYK